MAEASISAVLSRLGELGAHELALHREVGIKIMLLRDKLEWLQTFIRDVDRQRRLRENELMRLWVRQTCDVVCDVEDAVDEFALRPPAGCGIAEGLRAPCRWLQLLAALRGLQRQFQLGHRLMNKVGKIERRLEAMSKNREEYKLEHQASSRWTSCSTADYIDANWVRFQDEEFVVGFEDKMKTLKSNLTDKEVPQLAMIVVSGEGGTGKRTLVSNVCKCKEVENHHFDLYFWYSILPNARSTGVLLWDFYKKLIEKVHGSDEEVEDKTTSCRAEVISEILRKHKYLVVVDGIFTVKNYDSLSSVLPDNHNGSRLVFIPLPGSVDIGVHATLYKPLKMKGLEKKDALKLFCCRAFGRETPDNEVQVEFAKYENDIFNITKGLPLAIIVLAGLLRSKEMPSEWDTVLLELLPAADAHWQQQKNMSKRVLLDRLLSRSFDDLPHNLKSCFLYLAVFGPGDHIDVEHLIRLWIAEGFICPHKGKTLEEVAHSYLINLIWCNMLRVEGKDELDCVKAVSIHTRILAFAQSEAEEAGFLHAHDLSDALSPATRRRLSFQNWDHRFVPLTDSFPKLRSVVCNFIEDRTDAAADPRGANWGPTPLPPLRKDPEMNPLHFLYSSKFLRVLDLEGLALSILPGEICKLIHIRYLRLKCPCLVQLPPSIARLFNLQTLDVRGTQVKAITSKFWSIVALRHVLADKLSLPSQLNAHQAATLSNLQTVSGVVAPLAWPQEGCSPLEKAPALRCLKLEGLTAANNKVLARAFKKLERLMYLDLAGEMLPAEVFTLPVLCQLRRVELHGELEDVAALCSTKVHLLRPSLTVLLLEGTRLRQDFIDTVAKMGSLVVLELRKDSYCDKEMAFRERAFQRLEKLKLFDLPELREVTVEKSALPKLKEFEATGCTDLNLPEKLKNL